MSPADASRLLNLKVNNEVHEILAELADFERLKIKGFKDGDPQKIYLEEKAAKLETCSSELEELKNKFPDS